MKTENKKNKTKKIQFWRKCRRKTQKKHIRKTRCKNIIIIRDDDGKIEKKIKTSENTQ